MKMLFTLSALCVALSSFAQIEKGRSFVSGAIGSSMTNYKDSHSKTSYSGAELSYGYMVSNKWAVGLDIRGNLNKYTSSDSSVSHNNNLTISPSVRRYFSITDKLYFHIEGSVDYTRLKSWYVSSHGVEGPAYPANRYGITIAPGATYFVTNRIALNAILGSINYSTTKNVKGTGQASTGFATNLGLRYFNFGVSIFF